MTLLRRYHLLFAVLFVVILLVWLVDHHWLRVNASKVIWLPSSDDGVPLPLMESESKWTEKTSFKKILFWYEPYRGPKDLRLAGCPIWQCQIDQHDRALNLDVESYDAVVFHLRGWTSTNVPARRSPHQHYVFLSMESPAWRSTNMTEIPAGFFNWTMTYRLDSDVVNPYGWFSNISRSTENVPKEVAKNKTKLVAWFVSNCASHSGRLEYVRKMQKFVKVDVYGQCGTLKCPRSRQDECRQMLNRDYKFYLAFENSLCADYITEKFFDQMDRQIVPIVFDLHGHHSRAAPSHSFINAADFPTVKGLVDYLILLDRNDTLYNRYFEWKTAFKAHNAQGGMCRLCARLHHQTPSSSSPSKAYEDLKDWWERRAQCRSLLFVNESHWTAVPLLPS